MGEAGESEVLVAELKGFLSEFCSSQSSQEAS